MDADRIAAIAAAAVASGASSAPVAAPTVPGSVLLIDGDGYNYSCAGNDDTSPARARSRLFERIKGLRQATGAESIRIHLTYPSSNKRQRYAIATVKGYQSGRKSHRPRNWQFLRDQLENIPGAVSWGDREADDGMAYEATLGGVRYIVSGDKDLQMVPGIHVDQTTYEQVVVPVDAWSVVGANGKQYGRKWFYLQLLQGDGVDTIPGLERYVNEKGNPVKLGDKTAAKLLMYVPDQYAACNTVADLYDRFYGDQWADRMVEQAALLWLSRNKDASDWVPPEFLLNDSLAAAVLRLKGAVHAAQEH